MDEIEVTNKLILNRKFSTANNLTFQISCINELLLRYVINKENWVDPFARDSKIAGITNDINPETSAQCHMEAEEFLIMLDSEYDGILFDPPYSYRQISEHYKYLGMKATQKDTSYNFYRRAMNVIIPKIKIGGYAISFGWNSNGFGIKYGFKKIEILLVAHGMHHNDTIVTVEQKVKGTSL